METEIQIENTRFRVKPGMTIKVGKRIKFYQEKEE